MPAKLCSKGHHFMTESNTLRRKIRKNTYYNACRSCYNYRMKLFMWDRRYNPKKEVSDVVDIHVDRPDCGLA